MATPLVTQHTALRSDRSPPLDDQYRQDPASITALSTIERARRSAIADLRRGLTDELRHCYEWLVGAESGWLRACAEAARQHSALLDLDGAPTGPLRWAWNLINDLCPVETPTFPLVARSIAACARVAALLLSPSTQEELTHALGEALHCWHEAHGASNAGILSAAVQGEPRVAHHDQIAALLAQAARSPYAASIAPVYALVRQLAQAPTSTRESVTVPVLLDGQGYGIVADLRLELWEAPLNGCYADPWRMGFFQADSTFHDAVAKAWSAYPAQNAAVFWCLTVRASVQQTSPHVARAVGASAGAGFAVGLRCLSRAESQRLDPRWAITGAVGMNDAIEHVDGYLPKLSAAAACGLRVIVPAVDLSRAQASLPAGLHEATLRGAATVAEAAQYMTSPPVMPSPYRGLSSFREEAAPLFFGREKLIALLLERLQAGPRALILLGLSGSGKSSLVQAGLIPALRMGALPGSDRWQIQTTRPSELMIGSTTAGGPHRLLVVDQLEELFIAPPDERERQVRALSALPATASQTTMLLIMRDDFYSQLSRYAPALLDVTAGNLINLPPTIDRASLMELISEPARRGGRVFEEGLVDRIVEEVVGGQADVAAITLLPILQLTLAQLWEKASGETMTHATYHAIGRIGGAMTSWASTTIEQLPAEQRDIAQRLLTDLVHLGDSRHGLPDSRVRRNLRELCRDPEERVLITTIVTHLAKARLLIVTGGADVGDEEVELMHDTLVTNWDLLQSWLAEDRRLLSWRQGLEPQRRQWATSGATDDLLRGRELAEAEGWIESHGFELGSEGRAYIVASVEARRHEEAARELQQRQRLMGLAIITLLLSALTFMALHERTVATERLARSEAQRLAFIAQGRIQEDPELAVLLAIEAYKRAPGAEVENVLRQAIQGSPTRGAYMGHQGTVTAVAFSPDGRRIASASTDRTARIWDSDGTEQHVLRGHTDFVNAIAFSPDGTMVATASSDHTARLWSTSTGAIVRILRGHEQGIVSLAFSPDGRRLATASGLDDRVTTSDGTARIWDVASGQQLMVLRGDSDGIQQIAFSPNGALLATTGHDGTVWLWDARTGKQMRALVQGGPPWVALAFSPDSQAVALAGGDSVVRLYSTTTGAATQSLDGSPDEMAAISISPDGRTLAGAASSGRIYLWELSTGARRSLGKHDDRARTVSFRPDGQVLITGGADHRIRVWATHLDEEAGAFYGHQNAVLGLAALPGREVASASADGTARIWSASGTNRLVLNGHAGAVWDVAGSPDGRLLATASADWSVRIWDAQSGVPLRTLHGHRAPVRCVAFNPAGTLLASAGEDDTVRIWDVASGREVVTLTGHTGDIVDVVFDPQGQRLLTASNDFTARIWTLGGAGEPIVLRGHRAGVSAATFSPDGDTAMSASYDGTVRFWDSASGEPRPMATITLDQPINALAISPRGHELYVATIDQLVSRWEIGSATPFMLGALRNGHSSAKAILLEATHHQLVAAGDDGVVRLFPLLPADLSALAQQRATRTLSAAERSRYLSAP